MASILTPRIRWAIVAGVTLALAAWTGLKALEAQFPPAPDLVGLPGEFSDYSEVEPGLFMGGLVSKPPKGTKCVLNLCEFKDEYMVEHHYWNPIPDAEPGPDLDWLKKQVAIVAEHRSKDRPVYVHCFAGISRSGLVTAAYLMQKHGWTRDRALEHIRKTRPIANPNPAFMMLLREWEKR